MFAVWNEHYKFSRRYGLWDASTVRFNAALLFIVLLYVYPLIFLFIVFIGALLGFGTDVRLPNGDVVGAIEPEQLPLLMAIYGAVAEERVWLPYQDGRLSSERPPILVIGATIRDPGRLSRPLLSFGSAGQ